MALDWTSRHRWAMPDFAADPGVRSTLRISDLLRAVIQFYAFLLPRFCFFPYSFPEAISAPQLSPLL